MDPEAPLLPTEQGSAPTKAAVVATFEKIGEQCGQPLMSAAGLRLFGGHTARVTGGQVLAAIRLEINKIRQALGKTLGGHDPPLCLRGTVEVTQERLRAWTTGGGPYLHALRLLIQRPTSSTDHRP